MDREQHHERELIYSAWHRTESIERYVGRELAWGLKQIDLDVVIWVEYEHDGQMPLALVETARDTGKNKTATVTQNLAKLCDLPAYTVLYTPSDLPNPADRSVPDIKQVRVKRLWRKPEREFRTLTPRQWAEALVIIREWSARRLGLQTLAAHA